MKCWGCGKVAQGGVCLGPHPDFSLRRAVAYGHVTGFSALGVTTDNYRRRAKSRAPKPATTKRSPAWVSAQTDMELRQRLREVRAEIRNRRKAHAEKALT